MDKNQKFFSPKIGLKLRELRKSNGVSNAEDLSKLMEGKYSASGIRRREDGKLRIDEEFINDFGDALNLDKQEYLRAIAIANIGSWNSSGGILNGIKLHGDLVASTKLEKSFIVGGFSDLMQHYDYTREIVKCWGDSSETETRTQLRQENGKLELLKTSRESLIISHEFSLYNMFGNAEVMLKQLKHMRQFVFPSHIKFRILPMSCAILRPKHNGFAVYDNEFADSYSRIDPSYTSDPVVVKELCEDFDLFWANSVDGPARDALIDKAIAHYKALL